MRTTLTIDDDVMNAAKTRALAEHRPVGEVISDLARLGLKRGSAPVSGDTPREVGPTASAVRTRSGIPLLPGDPSRRTVTIDIVNEMRDAFD
jgi:hypothetical protein